MIIAYLFLTILFLAGLFWLKDWIKKIDDEIPPKANSEDMESEHLACYYKNGKLIKL